MFNQEKKTSQLQNMQIIILKVKEKNIWENILIKKNPLFQSHKHSHDSFLPTVIEKKKRKKQR